MEMLENMDVMVTDEITLLRERLDEAHAYIDNLERERDAAKRDFDAAMSRISQLMELDRDNHRLIDMMTQASNRAKKMLAAQELSHGREIERRKQISDRREMWSSVIGYIAGFVTTGLVVTLIMLAKGGLW